MDEKLITLQQEIAKLRALSPGRGTLRYPKTFKNKVAELVGNLSPQKICKALKLPAVSLYRWKNENSLSAKLKPEKSPHFVQLDAATLFPKAPIEIALPSGIVIRLSNLQNDALAALCKACA